MRKSKKERFRTGPTEIRECQIVETLHSTLQSNRFEDPPHRIFVVFGKKEDCKNITVSLQEYVDISSLSQKLIKQIRKELSIIEKLPMKVHEDTKLKKGQ